jgi:hypothetical protein
MECCDFITEGIARTCGNNVGGIKTAWLSLWCEQEFGDSSPLGYKVPNPDLDTALPKYFKFEFPKGGSTFTEVKEGEEANGSEIYRQTVTLKMNKREKSKREIIVLMGEYKQMSVIVEDNNGNFWLIGLKSGAILKSVEAPSGTNKSDHNGYTMTIEAEEETMAYPVTSAWITAMQTATVMED